MNLAITTINPFHSILSALVALVFATGCKDVRPRQEETAKETPVTDTAKATALLADTITLAEMLECDVALVQQALESLRDALDPKEVRL